MQNLKRIISRIAKDYHFGVNLHEDIKRCLPNENIRVIFDVGANEGQNAREFLRRYPSAEIHCFEPNPDCCKDLRDIDPRLIVVQTAVSSKIGRAGFDRSHGCSDMFRLTDSLSGEIVPIDTLDEFCRSNSVMQIDLLKIDTEGHDLEVIRGAAGLLTDNRIGILQAEVSMNPANKYHISFFDVHTNMEAHGYQLFAIHEQVNEWPTQEPQLRRANVCYISAAVIARNKRANLRQ
jgi:FkbM family methyltransferase